MRRQILTTTSLNAITYLAGFLKLWIVARLFGVGIELDGYYLALVLPTFVSGVLSGVLQTSLFPVRTRLANTSTPGAVERFERTVLMFCTLLGGLVALILAAVMFTIPGKVGIDTQSSTWNATVYVLPYALLLIPLTVLGNAMGYLLAFRGRYHWFAAAPIANALFSGGLLAAWPEGGLFNLALGTLLGLVLQVGLCALALERGGFRLVGIFARIGEITKEWREMFRLSAWILPGVLFANLTATLPTVFIASYSEGAVSAFSYAWRLHIYAVQLLAMGISAVILARFSELVAQSDLSVIKRLLGKALRFSILIGVAAAICVWTLGEYILVLVFGGKFDAQVASTVAGHWQWLVLALGPVILGNVLAKFFQACGRPHLLSLLTGIGFFVFLAVALLTGNILGSHAVPVAVTASALAIAMLAWTRANKIMAAEFIDKRGVQNGDR